MTQLNKLNKKDAKIMICEYHDIRDIFENYHYKRGVIGGGILHCFAMFINNKLVGGSIIGKPRHEGKYQNCIDIRRMALLDDAPHNSESWFISQIIKWVASNTDYDNVLSYSDMTAGHLGTIYSASNFECIGETSPTKNVEWNGRVYHPRSISIDRPYSYELREAIKNGQAKIITGLHKKIWLYKISKKLKRKNYIIGKYNNGNANTLF